MPLITYTAQPSVVDFVLAPTTVATLNETDKIWTAKALPEVLRYGVGAYGIGENSDGIGRYVIPVAGDSASSFNNGLSSARHYYSEDGINWTQGSQTVPLTYVVFGNEDNVFGDNQGIFIARGAINPEAEPGESPLFPPKYSKNGIDWSNIEASVGEVPHQISLCVFNGAMFVDIGVANPFVGGAVGVTCSEFGQAGWFPNANVPVNSDEISSGKTIAAHPILYDEFGVPISGTGTVIFGSWNNDGTGRGLYRSTSWSVNDLIISFEEITFPGTEIGLVYYLNERFIVWDGSEFWESEDDGVTFTSVGTITLTNCSPTTLSYVNGFYYVNTGNSTDGTNRFYYSTDLNTWTEKQMFLDDIPSVYEG